MAPTVKDALATAQAITLLVCQNEDTRSQTESGACDPIEGWPRIQARPGEHQRQSSNNKHGNNRNTFKKLFEQNTIKEDRLCEREQDN
jgi:hypothetical protein